MSKSKIEQEAEDYLKGIYVDYKNCPIGIRMKPEGGSEMFNPELEAYLAGAKKLAELLERRTELVEYEDVYSEEVIPLSALREIMEELK